jgi:hypothetical protein
MNRELVKKNISLQRRASVLAQISGEIRIDSAISRSLSRNDSMKTSGQLIKRRDSHQYNNIDLRRLSLVSNLDVIEDNSNDK